jgi:hypothetical protein
MTDVIEIVRRADPASGVMPVMSFDELSDRYVEADATLGRRRWIGTLAVAAAAMIALGIGWSVRSDNARVKSAGSGNSVKIPPDLLAIAKEQVPLAAAVQWDALSDGVITKDEIVTAAAGMADCMTIKGSGTPQAFEILGDDFEVPRKVDGRDDQCERDHLEWIRWGIETQFLVAALGEGEAFIAMNHDAAPQQIDAVSAALEQNPSIARFTMLGRDDVLKAIAAAAPEMTGPTYFSSQIGPTFRLSRTYDYTSLAPFNQMPGVWLVVRRDDVLTAPAPPSRRTRQPPSRPHSTTRVRSSRPHQFHP